MFPGRGERCTALVTLLSSIVPAVQSLLTICILSFLANCVLDFNGFDISISAVVVLCVFVSGRSDG